MSNTKPIHDKVINNFEHNPPRLTNDDDDDDITTQIEYQNK